MEANTDFMQFVERFSGAYRETDQTGAVGPVSGNLILGLNLLHVGNGALGQPYLARDS